MLTVSSIVSGILVFKVSGSSNIKAPPKTEVIPIINVGNGSQVFCCKKMQGIIMRVKV